MIFVTVGTQLGFDRLVQAVDGWAAENRNAEVFVQIGNGVYKPRYCAFEEFTEPRRWEAFFEKADRVVSHAGMGTIIKSLDHAKPLVIMPRLALLGEHRNDHQCATARRFSDIETIRVVNDACELAKALDAPFACGHTAIERNASFDSLLHTIRAFVANHR